MEEYSRSPNLYIERADDKENRIREISLDKINYYDKTKDDNTTYFRMPTGAGGGTGDLAQIEDIVIHFRYNTDPKSRFGTKTRRGTYSFKRGFPTIYEAIPISEAILISEAIPESEAAIPESEGGKKRRKYKSKKNSRHRIRKTRRRS
jgi:hypothetical protein